MRLFRWPGLTAVISLCLFMAKPSDVHSQWITTYSIGPAGVTTFGAGAFGSRTYAVSPFLAPGVTTFGALPSGFSTFGPGSFGLGTAQSYSVVPFGVSPLGMTGFTSSPASSRLFHQRRTVSSAPAIMVPMAPGTPPGNGGGGGDLTNEINQIKERLKKLESDVQVIKDRLGPGKVTVDKDLADQETQKKLKELRDKYDKYIKDNEDYNKKLAEIEVKMKTAADAIENAKTAADRNKAIEDLKAARKEYDSLKQPPHPTKNQ